MKTILFLLLSLTSSSWAARKPAGIPVRFVFVGDMMLSRLPGKFIAAGENPFQNFDSVLKKADVRVGNFECVAADGGKKFDKHYTFRADPKVLPFVAKYFDAVSLANNHTGDFGQDALVEMTENLQKNQIHYFGAGKNGKEAHTPWIVKRNGLKIAIFGYNEFRPRAFEAGPNSPGVAWSDDALVVADIKAVRPKVDLILTFMHWGEEYVTHPNDRQKALARKMIDAGADAVIGGHPHVPEGAETYKGKLIVYSLGNFVFDDYADIFREERWELEEVSRTSWVLQLTMDKKGLVAWNTIVSRTDENGFPRPVPGAKGPSSTSPFPAELLTSLQPKEKSEAPKLEDNSQLMNTEKISLSTVSKKPGSAAADEICAFSLDKEFIFKSYTMSNPQEIGSSSDGVCQLKRLDYNSYFEYPDPKGFDVKLKEIQFTTEGTEALLFPLPGFFRDFPEARFPHATFVSWMKDQKKITVKGVSTESDKNFETALLGVGDFGIKTDPEFVLGKDFHIELAGLPSIDQIRVVAGGYNPNRNLGYQLLCDFPAAQTLTIPASLTRQIPSKDVPQQELNISVEAENNKSVGPAKDRSFLAHVQTSRRQAITIPLKTIPVHAE